jgi:hypothetical protein
MKPLAEELTLELTCGACPEQYDVFYKGKEVGYLRLRHGHFRAECPFGNTIYEASPEGDGAFESHERDRYLKEASEAICEEIPSQFPELCGDD